MNVKSSLKSFFRKPELFGDGPGAIPMAPLPRTFWWYLADLKRCLAELKRGAASGLRYSFAIVMIYVFWLAVIFPMAHHKIPAPM